MIGYQSDLKTILEFIGDAITSIESMQSNVVPSCSLVCPKMHNSPLIFHLFTRSLHNHLWWLVACDGPRQRQPSWPFRSWYPEMWLCYHQRQVGRFGPIWWASINILGHVKLNPSERNSSSLQASCLDFSSGHPAARGECRQWVGVIYVSTFHMPRTISVLFTHKVFFMWYLIFLYISSVSKLERGRWYFGQEQTNWMTSPSRNKPPIWVRRIGGGPEAAAIVVECICNVCIGHSWDQVCLVRLGRQV